MNIVGIIISILIVSGMVSFIGLAIYQQVQKIRGKDKKTKKEKNKKGDE